MRAALACLVLAGCAECYLEQVAREPARGADDRGVHPNDRLTFRACIDGAALGCGGLWLVNGLEGGSAELGTIDTCGAYVAPAAFPRGASSLVFEASYPGRDEYGLRCEYAYRALAIAPP